MNRHRRPLALLVVALVLLAVLGMSCFGERRGLTRDGLLKGLEPSSPQGELPTLEELLALRAPPPPPAPEVITAARPRSPVEAGRLAIARGDVPAAEKAWASGGADVLADRCLAEGVLRRYEHVLEACGGFLAVAADDPRAVAAVRVLLRASSATRAASDLVAHSGPGWVKACGAPRGPPGVGRGARTCADLAHVVTEEAVDTARAVGERARFADAVLASGRLRRAHVEGPYDGELRALLALDAGGDALPPRRPHFRASDIVDEDGLFEPALRAAAGLYRLRLAGRGEGRATVYVTGSGAVRVRVDGVVVAERSPDAIEPAVTRAAVELARGDHEVEILASSAGRGDRIGVAFLDDDGRPALHERNATTAAAPPLRPAGARAVAPAGAMEALAVPVKGASDDVDALFRLLWRHAVVRSPSLGVDPDESKQIARALVSRFGWSPLALAVAAETMGDDRSVPDRISSSTAARLWDRVRAAWPEHPVARIAAARGLREERPDEALAAYRSLVSSQPRYPFGHRELIDLALDTGLVDEARASADALLKLEESAENIDAAIAALRAAGDVSRAVALEDKRALLDEDLADVRRARRLLDGGRTEEGLAALAEASRRERGSAALDEHIALLALRDPTAALGRVDEALADFPADAALVVRKAELLRHLRGDDEARTFLVRMLPFVRESERARRLAEALGVETPWGARLRLGDEVIRDLRARKEKPFAGHGLLALLDDTERYVYEDDSSLVIRHFVVELRTKEVLDRFGEIGTGDARVIRLRVVKPNGAVVEPERHRGVDDVSLPQLAPGDIVELLTVDRDSPPRLGGVFETRALDGSSTPALSRRYILTFPEGWDKARGVRVVGRAPGSRGSLAEKRSTFVDGEGRRRVRVELALEDVAPSAPEPFAAPWAETAHMAGFGWGVDDTLWARLRGSAIERAAIGDAWLDASAERIAGTGSEQEKLRRLFSFVVRRIEPSDGGGADDATAVLATGQGARTPLFLALARAAGLDASAVALHLVTQADPATWDNGSWSVVAVRVRHSGRESFAIVDGNAVLDQLPPVARGARVLDLSRRPKGPLVSALPDDVIDAGGVRVQADLAVEPENEVGDGKEQVQERLLKGLVVVTIPPAKADGARRGVRRATEEQLRQVLERSLVDSLPGVRVTEVKTPDVEAAGAALRLGARVEVPLPEPVDGAARFEHLFAQGASGGLQLIPPVSSYLGVADRKLPMLVTADREVLELQLSLPKAAAFVEAPEPLTWQAGPFSLHQRVEITDGVLYWRRELSTENARVPVEAWPGVHASLAGLAARTDARLSFVLPGTTGRPRSEDAADRK